MRADPVARLTYHGLMKILIFAALSACGQTEIPDTARGSHAAEDYESVRAQLRQHDQQVADAYSEEHAADLPRTVEEVFARHLEAVGGREAFDTIQTMVMRFTAHSTRGNFADLVRYYKKPHFFRQEISNSARAAVTDGVRFWWVSGEEWEADDDETGYLPLASMDNYLIDPDALGIRNEYDGVASVDGTPGFLIRRIWPSGRESHLFFSATSGLLTAVRSESPLTANSWFSYWDYRDEGGVQIPFTYIRSVGDAGPPHGLVLRTVEINVPLPDSLFLPPDER